ncbi:hypothetical protein [Streptomyces sp. NPDC048425]|uniref:hypothetical protein n=1 Tax=Streptomyces sp. NPDC048425 TaxID=3365548 RepID=UPI00371C6B97
MSNIVGKFRIWNGSSAPMTQWSKVSVCDSPSDRATRSVWLSAKVTQPSYSVMPFFRVR